MVMRSCGHILRFDVPAQRFGEGRGAVLIGTVVSVISGTFAYVLLRYIERRGDKRLKVKVSLALDEVSPCCLSSVDEVSQTPTTAQMLVTPDEKQEAPVPMQMAEKQEAPVPMQVAEPAVVATGVLVHTAEMPVAAETIAVEKKSFLAAAAERNAQLAPLARQPECARKSTQLSFPRQHTRETTPAPCTLMRAMVACLPSP